MSGANPEALGNLVPVQAAGPAVPAPTPTLSPAALTAESAIFPSPALNGPSAAVRNNHLVLGFSDADDLFVYFEDALGLSYAGGLLTVNIFWAAASAVFGDVEWFVAWERQNDGGPFDLDANDFAAELGVVSTAPGTSGFLAKASLTFTQAQADAVVAGDCFRLRILRDGGVGNDNMVGDAQLLRVTLEGT